MRAVLVIPCFREKDRLPPFLRDLAQTLRTRGLDGSILVVDDGSGAAEAAALLETIQPVREEFPELIPEPLLLSDNLGKGGAVYQGWDRACLGEVDLLGFVDADGATPANEICRLWETLERLAGDTDGVLGSRIRLLGRDVDRSVKRHLMGRVFATLTHWATGVKVYDSQCGAKLIKAGVYRSIRNLLQETGFAFDVELILAILQGGHRLVEVPVDWHDEPGSRVRMVRDSLRMFTSLLRIRQRLGRLVPVLAKTSTA